MITINSKLGTKEEISSLATKLRSVPDDKDDTVCPDVVKKLKQTEFYSVVVDLYKSNEELQFKRDATFLLRRVGYYGDKEDLKELVHRGIVRLILTDCVYSTDADLITNVVTVLRDVCSNHNRVLLSDIAEEGLYDKVIYLLETWKSNDDIAERILFMINTICSYEMSLGEDIVSLNQPRFVDILRNKHQLLREIISSDTSCKVTAAILLFKYLGSIEKSELLQLLIPPTNKMFTEGGIVKLASNIKAIPDKEDEFGKQVIREVVSADFISKFSEQYDSNTKEVYRRNLTYVLRRVASLGDKAVRSSLVKSGVIKHLITTWEHCTDSEVMCNISATLSSFVYDNGDISHVDHLVEEGVLTLISKLLQKWSEDDTVMVTLLVTLENITCYRKDIEELIANSTEYGNIPLLLQGLLETASSDSVIVQTIKVIRNLVVGIDVLHTVFLHASFFTTAFRHLQSTTLNSNSKEYLLCGIICTLANTNTDKMKDLLIPYSQPLKELAKTGSDSVLSVNAAILLNKYLDSIEESELLQLLIPPTNEMFTEGGIVKLASIIKAIPYEEEEFGKQVIREVVSADFISKFIEQYDSNTKEVYRRNLTYVLRRVASLGDKAVRSSLVKSGVIKHLITTWEHCTDSEVMCNISATLSSFVYDNGDISHVDHLVEEGVLTLISKLLQKWSEDDTVMVTLLVTLENITCYRKDIEELIANSTEYGNIPLLLQGLLETASSDSVIVQTIKVIRNLVVGIDVLHTVFLHASFFTTAFRHLQSITLNTDSKQYLLCGIICTLANKNTDKMKALLIPYSQPLKELAKIGSDSVLSVNAAILLNKYLDSIEESELLQLLIPPTNEMFTEGGIVKLASIIKAIPYEEEEFGKQVIREVVSADFISKFSEQYDSNTEEVYRRNLTYVLRRVAYLGDTAVISSLVKSGVIKHLITTWEHCTDSEVMFNISVTLQNIAYDNGDLSHVDHLVEEGVLTIISKQLQKWSEDDTVMVTLLGTLQYITCNRVDIKELIANSTEYGNIPLLLQELLETASSDSVIDKTIDVIRNLVVGTVVLHTVFLHASFFTTAFRHLQSTTLNSNSKEYLLCGIICTLANTNTDKMKDLLIPYSQPLKELAKTGSDSVLSVNAAILLNKYLGSIEESELLQLLIPPTNEMFTEGGIVKLASNIKAIPVREKEFRKQVIREVVSADFISKFIEQYDSNTEEVYRRNLTYVMAIVAYLGDKAVISSLVKSGVMKHLITTCELCTDSEVMCNISATLSSVVNNKGDLSHVDHLVEEGVLTVISKLLQNWSNDDTVMVELLGTLQNITSNRVDIRELIANSSTTEYGDIPELVTNIFQTSNNVEVLESTFGCINNMLHESMALHEHFSNKQLIDTCISRIRSDVLSSEYKIKILRGIVTTLTCNHPAKVAALLVPHTHSLKEIAELDTDTEFFKGLCLPILKNVT
ncbi:uncharacterized protein LOC134821018 [Bolinopsis microptera]|uniref:uncharacterized protein LOC134821018 n=1 Tax=Bolinopsis microptera TaxID=2820187 RepID=UPI00307A46B6